MSHSFIHLVTEEEHVHRSGPSFVFKHICKIRIEKKRMKEPEKATKWKKKQRERKRDTDKRVDNKASQEPGEHDMNTIVWIEKWKTFRLKLKKSLQCYVCWLGLKLWIMFKFNDHFCVGCFFSSVLFQFFFCIFAHIKCAAKKSPIKIPTKSTWH